MKKRKERMKNEENCIPYGRSIERKKRDDPWKNLFANCVRDADPESACYFLELFL